MFCAVDDIMLNAKHFSTSFAQNTIEYYFQWAYTVNFLSKYQITESNACSSDFYYTNIVAL